MAACTRTSRPLRPDFGTVGDKDAETRREGCIVESGGRDNTGECLSLELAVDGRTEDDRSVGETDTGRAEERKLAGKDGDDGDGCGWDMGEY